MRDVLEDHAENDLGLGDKNNAWEDHDAKTAVRHATRGVEGVAKRRLKADRDDLIDHLTQHGKIEPHFFESE